MSLNERDLHERLDAALDAITPRPAPVDGAIRRGRAIRVQRRAAAVAGVAAAVAIGVLAGPSLLHKLAASPSPATPIGRYTVTVQQPGVDSSDPVSFLGLTTGPVQVQYGAVRSDVTYVAVRLGNGTVLRLRPVTVYGVRAVAFAAPVGAAILDATAYSPRGEIAAAIPFNAPAGMADFGVWLAPGQHGLARASGPIGSGTGWSATAYLGPWGICFQVSRAGITSGSCVPTTSGLLGTGVLAWTGGSPGVAGGSLSASVAWVVVNQPDGTRTRVVPVTVGGQKFFAVQVSTGNKLLRWTAYDSSGAGVGSSPS